MADAVGERHRGPEAEGGTGAGDVGIGLVDVAGRAVGLFDLGLVIGLLFDGADEIEHCLGMIVAEIEDAMRRGLL